MLSMIADEENEVTSSADTNGNKQLFPTTAAGLLSSSKNIRRSPSSEQESRIKPLMEKVDNNNENNTLKEWVTDMNDNDKKETKAEEDTELHAIYLPNVGIIRVDAISEV